MANFLQVIVLSCIFISSNLYLIFTEVTVIIFVEVAVGIIAIIAGFGFKHTYVVGRIVTSVISVHVYHVFKQLLMGVFVGSLYFLSLGLIALLEFVAKWK